MNPASAFGPTSIAGAASEHPAVLQLGTISRAETWATHAPHSFPRRACADSSGRVARIVNVACSSHYLSYKVGPTTGIRFDQLAGGRAQRLYQPWASYGQSKLAMVLHVRALAQVLRAQGATNVVVLAAHPGIAHTGLQRWAAPGSQWTDLASPQVPPPFVPPLLLLLLLLPPPQLLQLAVPVAGAAAAHHNPWKSKGPQVHPTCHQPCTLMPLHRVSCTGRLLDSSPFACALHVHSTCFPRTYWWSAAGLGFVLLVRRVWTLCALSKGLARHAALRDRPVGPAAITHTPSPVHCTCCTCPLHLLHLSTAGTWAFTSSPWAPASSLPLLPLAPGCASSSSPARPPPQ